MASAPVLGLAQLNPVVGDIEGNTERLIAAIKEGGAQGADLVVAPELILSGYPPEDLVLRRAYVDACMAAADRVAAATKGGPAVLFGTPWAQAPGCEERRPHNVVLGAADGAIVHRAEKVRLPDYGVFDEPRTFVSGVNTALWDFGGLKAGGTAKIGILVCEDMWYPEGAAELANAGATLIIVPHGSPFRDTAHEERLAQARARAEETGVPIVFVNQVGGQDELVFDGGAFAIRPDGSVWRAPLFNEGVTRFDMDAFMSAGSEPGDIQTGTNWPTGSALTYEALVLGTRDYIGKSGFKAACLGLSGGIDSALVAAIASDAIGPQNVRCLMMPSAYTSSESLEDAAACAEALGVQYDNAPIVEGVAAVDQMLAPLFAGLVADVTEENVQSRLRGLLLMALSNKTGALLLSTGNKSEMAVGYATLYGDMNGAFNPLKDVYKTDVFALAQWRNDHMVPGGLGPRGMVIPQRIIDKPPSAELRPDQRDDDSLPPYSALDDILRGLIEEEAPFDVIAARGHDIALIAEVQGLLYRAEYKRYQAPPGPKVTARGLGRDRRFPLVNRWRG